MMSPDKAARPMLALLLAPIAYVLLLAPVMSHAADETQAGRQLFEKRCTGCHALDRSKEGPRLGGVYGRKVGSVEGFNYSEGMKKAGFTWDEQHLERWLTDTDSVVPDNNMDFHVASAEERAAIIRYLKAPSIPAMAARD
jgi:cytochrome c